MSEDRTGRELTPRPEEEPSAVTPREPALPTTAPPERFSAGQQAHTVGLTEERSAQIVRSSGNARMVAFLLVLAVVLFIPIYWLLDIGLPWIGFGGRLEAAANQQYVTDVSRGYALFLANCARCHGEQGQGGIGPKLNDQGKLYQAVNGEPPTYTSGKGHLNPDYVHNVLAVGGRYVCGDATSLMPVWLAPNGPLDYRQVNDIVQFIVASNQTSWVYQPSTGESIDATPAPSVTVNGWRDPTYSPPPGATPVPACWKATPAPSAPTPTPGGVTTPGTSDNPRNIAVNLTSSVTIQNDTGSPLTQIAVVPGETVKFDVTNSAGFDHNFYVGPADQLAAGAAGSLTGIPQWTAGTKELSWTVPSDVTGLQFACIVAGHYQTMHGDFVAAPGGSSGSPAATSTAASGAPPTASPAPSASP
jgi:mono/diheme cytochrome c family protein